MIQTLDLRQLCSAILEKTIADPDMYQHGKSKIFFRAGMLAALETFRSDRLYTMVTVVQKNIRRRQAMQKYRKLRQSTIKIQTWWRGILARRLAENLRREASAVRLQRGIRSFIQRKRFLDTRQGIVLFQSRMCHHSLSEFLLIIYSIGVRGMQTRHQYLQERSFRAATLLQSLFRGV
jgi:myosin-5